MANAALVAALRDYPGELSFLSAAEPAFVDDGLALLEGRTDLIDPVDLDRARREWRVLSPLVRSRAETFPGVDLQPVHGDSPAVNIFSGAHGDLFSDFEPVTLGPVEWDMAALGPDGGAVYGRRAHDLGLRPLDEGVLRFVDAVGMLRAVSCLALAPQLPLLMDALHPLDAWRAMPFAAGLSD